MRLGQCVALELGAVAMVVGGACAGIHQLRVESAAAPPVVATLAAVAPPALPPAPRVEPVIPPAPVPDIAAVVAPVVAAAPPSLFGASDDVLTAPLRHAAVTNVKINHGGTSLSLRLDFDSGARAAFKPEQIHTQSSPRREVAAYVIDRLLGLGRIAPAFARTFTAAELIAAVPPASRGFVQQRLTTEGIARKGRYAGVVMWWVPEIDNAKIGNLRIDSTDGVITWKRYLRAKAPRPAAHAQVLAGISTMTLFDFLIDNIDRWTGSNTRVQPATGEVLFMDNTMSFTTDADGHSKSHIYLQRVQVFSRAFVTRLRSLDQAAVRQALDEARGDFPALLTEPELKALFGRQRTALAYIDELIATYGDDVVLGMP